MKKIIKILIVVFLLTSILIAQENYYWKNAPVEGSKIYSIFFADQQNGHAISSKGEIFETTDSGNTWISKNEISKNEKKETNNNFWSVDVYCSVMQTKDGGKSWLSYTKEAQEHFCGVYLKDNNSGYKIANEFLNKVSSNVFSSIRENEINSLIDHPQQCTEYYSNETEGWALGWCLRNFKKN
jgi:hypothetical protein